MITFLIFLLSITICRSTIVIDSIIFRSPNPKVFRNLWDPKLLYPERDVFHVSEVTAFVGFVGLYFFAIGDMKLAQEYYEYLYKLAPTNPQTLRMKNVLFPEIEGYIQ